jgi:hypothetical protein
LSPAYSTAAADSGRVVPEPNEQNTGLTSARATVTRLRRRITVLGAIAIIVLPETAVVVGATDYVIYPLAESASFTTLVVPGDGIVPLHLSRSGDVPPKPETLGIALTTFVDARGRTVPVALLVGDEEAQKPIRPSEPRTVTVDKAQIPLRLHVGDIPSPRSLSGHLLLSRDGVRIKTYAITLIGRSAERGAKLKLDRGEITVDAVERLLGFIGEPARFSVTLRDESGDWPLEGLHARVEEAKGPGGSFDPQEVITLGVNGTVVDSLWTLDAKSTVDPLRIIPVPGQAIVQGTLADLPPGQYTAKIRFLAANSQTDPGQVLTLKVNVRKSLGFAIGLLLLGIVVSLVATVVLKSRAATIRLRLRILQLRPNWLADEPSSLVVTWVRSIFNQAEALRQQFTVAATDIMEERVTQAAQHLPYLAQIGSVRRRIDRSGWHRMVRRRAHKVLQRINTRLVPGRLDDQTGATVQREIDGLNAWFVDDWAERYWEDLKRDIDAVLGAVDVNAFEDQARRVVEDLVKRVEGPRPPTPKGLVEQEACYAALKLRWERRDQPDQVKDLADGWERRRRVEELFLYADAAAWKMLKDSSDEVWLVKPRQTSIEPFEPFQPLLFEVAPDRPELGDNFLFKHNLRFQWHIALAGRNRSQGIVAALRRLLGLKLESDDEVPPLTPETQEPLVVQYAPHKCTMTASVRLRYRGDSFEVKAGPGGFAPFRVTVAGSAFKRLMRSVETTEMVSLGLAVVVGTASGLLTQYFGNAAWGSARDCIGLFLWGVGADQASKSFLDVVNRFPRWQEVARPNAADRASVPTPSTTSPSSTVTAHPATAAVPGVGGIAPTQAPPV